MQLGCYIWWWQIGSRWTYFHQTFEFAFALWGVIAFHSETRWQWTLSCGLADILLDVIEKAALGVIGGRNSTCKYKVSRGESENVSGYFPLPKRGKLPQTFAVKALDLWHIYTFHSIREKRGWTEFQQCLPAINAPSLWVSEKVAYRTRTEYFYEQINGVAINILNVVIVECI